jgi:hypothetical protein
MGVMRQEVTTKHTKHTERTSMEASRLASNFCHRSVTRPLPVF